MAYDGGHHTIEARDNPGRGSWFICGSMRLLIDANHYAGRYSQSHPTMEFRVKQEDGEYRRWHVYGDDCPNCEGGGCTSCLPD